MTEFDSTTLHVLSVLLYVGAIMYTLWLNRNEGGLWYIYVTCISIKRLAFFSRICNSVNI